jgi:NTE family protein
MTTGSTDARIATRPDEIALCLSGGGFRATLFHLGALRRLNEVGLLARVNAISSVSGGSILAAHLATTLRPWPTVPLSDDEFERRIVEPIEAFSARNIRTGPLARQFLPWNWPRSDAAVRALAKIYATRLTGLRLGDLHDGPRFLFCATDMAFGVPWIFDTADPDADAPRALMGDSQVGYAAAADVPLALAVAASSCFPVVFNPLEMHLDPGEFQRGRCNLPDRDRLVRGVSLSDGAAYDSLGSEPVVNTYGTMLFSDSGPVFEAIGPMGRFAFFQRLNRFFAVAGHFGASVRRQRIFEMFVAKQRRGTFWGIGTPPSRYRERDARSYSDDLVDTVIDQVRIDIDAFSPPEQAVLQNHGYLQADAAIRSCRHSSMAGVVGADLPATRAPFPDLLDPARVRATLKGSDKVKIPFGRI